jgi:hypothetical protein
LGRSRKTAKAAKSRRRVNDMDSVYSRLVAHLIEITQAKVRHLEQVLILTQQQTNVLKEEDYEALTRLIDRKQTHIDDIKKLDSDFEKIYSEINEKPLVFLPALQESVSKVQKLVVSIQIIETENNAIAKEAIDETKKKLKNIGTGKKGYNAYRNAALYGGATRLDENK